MREFLKLAVDESTCWDGEALKKLAAMAVPDAVFRNRVEILRGDIYRDWVRWFAQSLGDPFLYSSQNVPYARIFADVFGVLRSIFPELIQQELQELASVVSNYLDHEARRLRAGRQRVKVSRSEKLELLERSGDVPRCWITGREFTEQAIERFLGNYTGSLDLPLYVDVLRPVGVRERDIGIEIDHVVPYAKGGDGGENLALSSGWANLHKTSNVSLYDAPSATLAAPRSDLGFSSLPRPFWVVRLLGARARCEHEGGCESTSHNSELTVAPRFENGALVPTNLKVVCTKHDPMRERRLVPRARLNSLPKPL